MATGAGGVELAILSTLVATTLSDDDRLARGAERRWSASSTTETVGGVSGTSSCCTAFGSVGCLPSLLVRRRSFGQLSLPAGTSGVYVVGATVRTMGLIGLVAWKKPRQTRPEIRC